MRVSAHVVPKGIDDQGSRTRMKDPGGRDSSTQERTMRAVRGRLVSTRKVEDPVGDREKQTNKHGTGGTQYRDHGWGLSHPSRTDIYSTTRRLSAPKREALPDVVDK